jgi:hypothetical protein
LACHAQVHSKESATPHAETEQLTRDFETVALMVTERALDHLKEEAPVAPAS